MSSPFFDLVEAELVSQFPKQYRRANGKLTASERERLGKSLQETWQLARHLGDDDDTAQKEIQEAKLRDLLSVKDMAVFLYTDITQSDREKIAASLQQDERVADMEIYDDTKHTKGFGKILSTFVDRLSKANGGRINIPEGAPLDIFSFFDQWQEDIDNCIPLPN